MIKLLYCIRKRPDLSDEEFSDYWRNVHGPLGLKIPHLRRLVQNHLRRVAGDRPPDFDGVAELWFDNENDLLAARRSPEWAASSADETNFIDAAGSRYMIATEHEIHGGTE